MNKFVMSAIASVLVSTSMSTLAASTTKLTVTGTTPVPACDVTSALADANFDYTAELTSIRPLVSMDLPPKTKTDAVVITCSGPTGVKIAFADDRVSSAGQNNQTGPAIPGLGVALAKNIGAGLGFTASGAAIGGYWAFAGQPVVDGTQSTWVNDTNGNLLFGHAQFANAAPYETRLYGIAAVGSSYSFPIKMSGTVNALSASDINSSVTLDGSQTISIIYI